MANLTMENLKTAWTQEHIANMPNANNCSGFIHSTLKEAGITIPYNLNANNLVDYFSATPTFIFLGTGDGGYSKALAYAKQNKIVIVGAKSTELKSSYGHVAIVLGTGYIYGGSIGSAQSH
jgi:hypothetical protein